MWRILTFSQYETQLMKSTWQGLAVVGGVLLLVASVIFVVPVIFAYLVAVLILWAGVVLLVFSWRIRNAGSAAPGRSEFWEII